MITKRILLTLLSLFMIGQQVIAQETNKEVRKEKRAAQMQLEREQIQDLIATKSWVFSADQLVYSGTSQLQNVDLIDHSYGVWVLDNRINVYLPVYGTNAADGMPSLSKTLDFTTTKFKYSVQEDSRSKGWNVMIKVMNPWTMTNYSMTFEISETGQSSHLMITSDFTGEVTFLGAITPFQEN